MDPADPSPSSGPVLDAERDETHRVRDLPANAGERASTYKFLHSGLHKLSMVLPAACA